MRKFVRRLGLVAVVGLMGCPRPPYPKCETDKDCKEAEFCVNGQCQQCRDDKDCKDGKICKAGRCEEKPGPKACTTTEDCPPNQSCLDGVCKPCSTDAECGDSGKCVSGRCSGATRAEAPPKNPACSLEPIYFDFNESALSSEAAAAAERDADCIKKMAHSATLTGHADVRGTDEYNLALSDRRAQSVKDRLVRLGLDGSRLRTVARGKLDAGGSEESGWAKDRRVDVSW